MISPPGPWDVCCGPPKSNNNQFGPIPYEVISSGAKKSSHNFTDREIKSVVQESDRGRTTIRPAPDTPQSATRNSQSPYRQSPIAAGGVEIYPRAVLDRSISADKRNSSQRHSDAAIALDAHRSRVARHDSTRASKEISRSATYLATRRTDSSQHDRSDMRKAATSTSPNRVKVESTRVTREGKQVGTHVSTPPNRGRMSTDDVKIVSKTRTTTHRSKSHSKSKSKSTSPTRQSRDTKERVKSRSASKKHRKSDRVGSQKRHSFVPAYTTPRCHEVPIIIESGQAPIKTTTDGLFKHVSTDQIGADFVHKIGTQLGMMGIGQPGAPQQGLFTAGQLPRGGQTGNIMVSASRPAWTMSPTQGPVITATTQGLGMTTTTGNSATVTNESFGHLQTTNSASVTALPQQHLTTNTTNSSTYQTQPHTFPQQEFFANTTVSKTGLATDTTTTRQHSLPTLTLPNQAAAQLTLAPGQKYQNQTGSVQHITTTLTQQQQSTLGGGGSTTTGNLFTSQQHIVGDRGRTPEKPATTTTKSPLGLHASIQNVSGMTRSYSEQLRTPVNLTPRQNDISRSLSPLMNMRTTSQTRVDRGSAREIAMHELTAEHVIISENYKQREATQPKRLMVEEVFQREVIVPETRITEHIVEEMQLVREKVVEIEKKIYQEKIVEVPEIIYTEKIVEVPERVIQERIVEVPVIQIQERIVEIPKYIQQEKLIEFFETEVREVAVEKVVEKIVEVEEYKVREIPVARYVDKPVPQYVNKEEIVEVNRNIPIPIEAVKIFEFKLPKIRPHYVEIPIPIYSPRFVEVAIPAELLSPTQLSQCEQISKEVALLAYASSQRAISLCEIERVGVASKSISPLMKTQIDGGESCLKSIAAAWNSGDYSITGHAINAAMSDLPLNTDRLFSQAIGSLQSKVVRAVSAPGPVNITSSNQEVALAAIHSAFGAEAATEFVEMLSKRQSSETPLSSGGGVQTVTTTTTVRHTYGQDGYAQLVSGEEVKMATLNEDDESLDRQKGENDNCSTDEQQTDEQQVEYRHGEQQEQEEEPEADEGDEGRYDESEEDARGVGSDEETAEAE